MDLRGLMIPLLPAQVGQGNYTAMDRYRDFRAVFFGDASAEQKEKVLFQILAACELHGIPMQDENTHETSRWMGRRDVGMAVLRYLTSEPQTNQFVPTTESMDNANG
jgi:hypothetical protein